MPSYASTPRTARCGTATAATATARPRAARRFWGAPARFGGFAGGMALALALPRPALAHGGRDGWQTVEDSPPADTGLGFHVAVLASATLPPGSRVDFTWRGADGAE